MADVLISCETSGCDLAERLARILESEGFLVARNLPPEESEIELAACKAAVVIWTADALNSPHVLANAEHAHKLGKLINARAPNFDPDRVASRFHSKRAIARTDDAAIIAGVRELVAKQSQANAPREVHESSGAVAVAAAAHANPQTSLPVQRFFVSHVAEDRKAALEVVRKLEQRGIQCWIAPRNIQPGKPYDDEIVGAIEACLAMLLIFSERLQRQRLHSARNDTRR